MRFLHPQHLIWVLLCGLLLLCGREAASVSEEAVKEVIALNSTTEKELSPLKIRNDKLDKRPVESLSDGINAVPLSPEEDVEDKDSDQSSPELSEESAEEKAVSPKELVPEKSERIPKNLDTPHANAVVSDADLSTEEKMVSKTGANSTVVPDDIKSTTKSSSDDSTQYEYPPKGRTLSYDKDNSTNGDNADVLKNTVPSEPKAVKLEENTDKDGERWIKKQRGITNPSQSTTEFKSRANKERNLSASYLPGLAVLNTVNTTSESEINNDKFSKYQRRKRPWSAQINSSDLSIPEETTVWSLASMKATPKDKPHLDVKPIVPWSTMLNKPTTEYQPKPSVPTSTPTPTTAPLPSSVEVSSTSSLSGESDWVGISKIDIGDVPSVKVSSLTTDKPQKLIEANFTSPSSSINLIDTSSDKEVFNETTNAVKTEEPVQIQNESKPSSTPRTPELSNVINESDTTIKIPPPLTTSTPAVSTTTESVKNLSIYPSPISNSVNELHEDADPDGDGPLLPIESSHQNNVGTEHPDPSVSDILSRTTESVPHSSQIFSASLNNSNHPNITKMFTGKNSYASNFDFSTPSSSSEGEDPPLTSKPENEILSSEVHNTTISVPVVETSVPELSLPITTKAPSFTTTSSEKIVHVTSTMLPEKGRDSSEKITLNPSAVSIPSSEPSSTTDKDFSVKLFDMFNVSHNTEPSSSFTSISPTEKPIDILSTATSQPKEVNEIPLDIEKSLTSTEKIIKPILTTIPPASSTLPTVDVSEEFETSVNDTVTKTNEDINDVEPTVITEKNIPKINSTEKHQEVTSVRDDSKQFDLFNSTDDLTVSKFPSSMYTVDKVTVSTTVEPPVNYHSEEDIVTINDTQPFPSKESKESDFSIEQENRTPVILTFPIDNSSKSEEESTPKFYPSTEEPQKVPVNPEITPSPDVEVTGEEEHDRYPGSEEDAIYDTSDPVFTRLLVQANDKELCSSKEELRNSIIRLFKTNGSDIHRKQVIINNLGPKECLFRNPPSDDGLFPIQVYLINSQGHNDMFLTDRFIDLWQQEGLDFSYPVKRVDKVIGMRKFVEMDKKSEGNSSLIAAIVISSIAGVCLLFIVILLFVIRKRQKGFNYGQRCTPVSLEDYSLDNISVYNSTRRKAARASKRSYGNPAFDDPGAISHVVNFATLGNFCNNRSMIDEEFTQIPTVSVKPDELPPGVETKNRFANVIPIPETRVVLNTTRGNNPEIDTYINANYVKGAKGEEKFYIACQAPMADTVSDFWQMIWEQQSRLVIMLTDLQEGGVEKSADYLPPSEVLDCHRVFGDLQVTLKKREVTEKYVISNLQLKNLENNLWREVVHLWLTCWPPLGVPSEPTAVIAFLIEARSYIKSKENSSPIVVHCSPGTGRTGTIIAIDICIRDFEVKRTIDVPKTVCNIRKDRAGSVQTKDQYAFIYQVLQMYATKLTGGGLDSI